MTSRQWHTLRWLPFAGVVLVLFVTGLSHAPVLQLFVQQDKLHHLAGFPALSLTARLAFPGLRSGWLLLIMLSMALLSDLGQELLPHRTPSLGDMFANLLGVLLGWLPTRKK